MPIYNKEKYLIERIKIIQEKTLKDIEIIIVNDGSMDNSLKISKYLDKRIKIIINERNHGLLYSRAIGIINSTGKYVFHLDPDNKLSSPTNLKLLLYNKVKLANVDKIFGNKWNFHEDNILNLLIKNYSR